MSGMGELHLDVYVERMLREYGIACIVGNPRVNYRETVRMHHRAAQTPAIRLNSQMD